MNPTIREYRTEDLDTVVRLSLDAWSPVFAGIREQMGDDMFRRQHGDDWREYQRGSVEQTLRGAAHAWVAEVDGAVTAFAVVVIHDDGRIGELAMLAVAPEHQSQGLGALLTQTALDWIRDAGITVAMVETGGDPGHAPARRVYESAGFTRWPVARYFKAL